MVVHDGEKSFKAQLTNIDKYKELIISLHAKVTENHKVMIAHQETLKHIIEGMDKNKRLKNLYGLECDVDQDVMATMDFTASPVYCHLQVTVISNDGWCWALAWR